MKKPLIILTGPTAVGKTKASIGLAKAVGGEIISADSMQVYKKMNIGSAKILPEEMNGVPHHLIDILQPQDAFDVVRFQTLAKQAMQGIYERGHIPIIVGGTGFYIQSVLYDIDFSETTADEEFRREMEQTARTQGAQVLHDRLQEVDPDSAEAIPAGNVKRVIRALEFYRQTGTPISVHNAAQRQKAPPYQFAYFVLSDERANLYARIDARVDQMMQDGLLKEVRALITDGCTKEMVSMQGLGYKELLAYLDGAYTLEKAIERIKRDTRHFAKRQLTWFRRERDVVWIEKQKYAYDEEKILQAMLACLRERGII